MKFYTAMPPGLKTFYQKELNAYRTAFSKMELQIAWRHLERAHILGQPYPWQHTNVHLKMLKFGIKIKNWNEVLGQIPRLFVGGIKSFVGKIPVGNTGRTNVPPLKPMEVPKDLQMILDKYK